MNNCMCANLKVWGHAENCNGEFVPVFKNLDADDDLEPVCVCDQCGVECNVFKLKGVCKDG